MKRMTLTLGVTIIIGTLNGCATPEYNAAKNACEAEWLQKLPPLIQQRSYTYNEYKYVPSGNYNCSTYGSSYGRTYSGQTNCTQTKTYQAVPQQRSYSFDANSSARNKMVRQCAEQQCMEQYGNPNCEVAKPKVTSATVQSQPEPKPSENDKPEAEQNSATPETEGGVISNFFKGLGL